MNQFDDQTLNQFAHEFYGHGNLAAAYWFVGMEHGGGHNFENIKRRIDRWVEQGKESVTDLAAYCTGIGEGRYFQQPAKNQPTWNKLIRLLLRVKEEEPVALTKVKAYQAEQWGRGEGETCLLELLPLANPSLNHRWLYADHSTLAYLATRKTYWEYLTPIRANRLREMIAHYQPRLVHFYGDSYAAQWRQIADVSFRKREIEGDAFAYGRLGHTLFVITKHPVAKGITIRYFQEIGAFLREALPAA